MEKIRDLIIKYKVEITVVLSIILISIISFNFGKLKASRDIKKAISIYEGGEDTRKLSFKVVASKNSNKYHFEWCSGANRISPKNKITFEDETAAIIAGYTLAGNCNK